MNSFRHFSHVTTYPKSATVHSRFSFFLNANFFSFRDDSRATLVKRDFSQASRLMKFRLFSFFSTYPFDYQFANYLIMKIEMHSRSLMVCMVVILCFVIS